MPLPNPTNQLAAQVAALQILASGVALYVKKMARDPNFDSTLREIISQGASVWTVDGATPDQANIFRREIATLGTQMVDMIARQPLD